MRGPKLPPGTKLSADQTSAPVSFGEDTGPGTVRFPKPEMLGIQCQIQHPQKAGKGMTTDPGLLGAGVVMTTDGLRFMLQLQHPDGSSMAAILSPQDYISFADIFMTLGVQGQALAAGRPQ